MRKPCSSLVVAEISRCPGCIRRIRPGKPGTSCVNVPEALYNWLRRRTLPMVAERLRSRILYQLSRDRTIPRYREVGPSRYAV